LTQAARPMKLGCNLQILNCLCFIYQNNVFQKIKLAKQAFSFLLNFIFEYFRNFNRFTFNNSTMRFSLSFIYNALSYTGNTLTAIGCFSMLLGVFGIFDMEIFSFGLSSGVRIIGTVAIAGCLLSAIGYGISDYANN
jgi:hypothetical protein